MENYDIQSIQNMLGQSAQTAMQTAMTVANLSEQMGMISTKVNTQEIELNQVKNRLDTLEYRSEISGAMCTNIKSAASRRLIEILGEEDYNSQKYNSLFYARIYTDVRKNAGLCKPIAMTQRGDYQRILSYIEAWIPSCGINNLKKTALERAEIRRINKANGFI